MTPLTLCNRALGLPDRAGSRFESKGPGPGRPLIGRSVALGRHVSKSWVLFVLIPYFRTLLSLTVLRSVKSLELAREQTATDPKFRPCAASFFLFVENSHNRTEKQLCPLDGTDTGMVVLSTMRFFNYVPKKSTSSCHLR